MKNHHVNRAPDVETCREEKINANLLAKFQLLPAEVRETERTTLKLEASALEKKINMKGANHASPFQQDKVANPVNNTHVLTF